MIDIAIEYPYLFFKRKVKSKVPSSWAELTEQQFIAISRTINGTEPGFRFLSELTGISQNLLKKLSPFELFKLSEGIDFVGQAGNSHSAFIIHKISGTDFVSPKPKLAGLTFGQFIFTESYYNDWLTTKDEMTLNNFVASLYLPFNEKFTNETIPNRIGKIADTALDIRKAIAFNYSLVLIWLQKAYPLIFQTSTCDPDITRVDGIRPNQSGWLKLFESLVGDDLINQDRYAELPLHTVLRHLTTKYKESVRKG